MHKLKKWISPKRPALAKIATLTNFYCYPMFNITLSWLSLHIYIHVVKTLVWSYYLHYDLHIVQVSYAYWCSLTSPVPLVVRKQNSGGFCSQAAHTSEWTVFQPHQHPDCVLSPLPGMSETTCNIIHKTETCICMYLVNIFLLHVSQAKVGFKPWVRGASV